MRLDIRMPLTMAAGVTPEKAARKRRVTLLGAVQRLHTRFNLKTAACLPAVRTACHWY